MIASDSIYFSLKNMDIALSFLVAMFVVFYPVLSKVIPVCLVYWRRPSWSLLLSSESGLSLCRRAQFDEIRLVELGVDWGVNAGWSRHRRGEGGGFRGSWARTRLLPGRTKELWVGARRVEIVTHGTRAGSRSSSSDVRKLGVRCKVLFICTECPAKEKRTSDPIMMVWRALVLQQSLSFTTHIQLLAAHTSNKQQWNISFWLR